MDKKFAEDEKFEKSKFEIEKNISKQKAEKIDYLVTGMKELEKFGEENDIKKVIINWGGDAK